MGRPRFALSLVAASVKDYGTKRPWKVAILVLAAALFLPVLLRSSKQPRQFIDLPDGSRITFLGVEFGQNHDYPPNARALKFISRLLPFSLRNRLGIRGGFAIGQDSVFFWYRHDRRAAQSINLERAVVDENGVESAVVDFGCSQQLSTNANLEGCGATVWPRRSARLGLRFYHSDGTNPPAQVGEFWMRNPGRMKAPQWIPQVLPASTNTGDLQITVLGFGNESSPHALDLPSAASLPNSVLRFRTAWKGRPSTAWSIRQALFEDATGNKLTLWDHSDAVGGEEILRLSDRFRQRPPRWQLPCTLWSGEDAWKVQVFLGPRADAEFSPEELWRLGNVDVPSPDEIVQLNIKTNLQGIPLVVDSLWGKASDPSGEEHLFADRDVLLLQSNVGGPEPVIVQVVDDAGRTVQAQELIQFSRQVNAKGWASFRGVPLNISQESKRVEITFGFKTNRTAVFFLPPPQRAASASSGKDRAR